MNTIRLVSIAALAALAIAALVIFVPTNETKVISEVANSTEIRFDKIKSEADMVNFLSQFGYAVEAAPAESVEVKIPKDFDKVFAAYNELQKGEGLDLGRYKGKSVMRYTYKVTNYSGYQGTVLANLLVYKNKIIGADICSADPSGFAHGLRK